MVTYIFKTLLGNLEFKTNNITFNNNNNNAASTPSIFKPQEFMQGS